MMGFAAVPAYFNKHLEPTERFQAIAPGHRFGLFFPIWRRNQWDLDDRNKSGAIREVLPISKETRVMVDALCGRQQYLTTVAGEDVLTITATATAPFMTGIGNEHPLENGFSFLSPYGLPYLPGSGVKGILRLAAEELASGEYGDRLGWEYLYVWLLFGFEASSAYLVGAPRKVPDPVVKEEAERQRQIYINLAQLRGFDGLSLQVFMRSVLNGEPLAAYETRAGEFLTDLAARDLPGAKRLVLRDQIHTQGALSFWDVFPSVRDQSMRGDLFRIEILTPHHADYYQKGTTPVDCEQPNPNPFLAVAPGCRFVFHIQCDTSKLPQRLKDKWRDLLTSAFEHAFHWLGFGAKTAVGYGQMQTAEIAKGSEPASIALVGDSSVSTLQTTISRTMEIWEKATLSYKKNDRTLIATHSDGNRKSAPLKNPDQSLVPEELHKKLFKDGKAVAVKVSVSVRGNLSEIVAIEECD